MKREEFYYLSADKKTQIHAVEWKPEGEIKGIIQIIHGVTEHILRYEECAKFFTEKGFVVVGNDHIGHGESIAPNTEPMYFGKDGSWNFVVRDMKKCMELTKQKYINTPYYMIGFSLGSFVLRTYLIDYNNDKIDGAVIIGTGDISKIEANIAMYMANKEAKKVGEEHTSPVIKQLTFDTYNKKFKPNKTDFDWLCASEEQLDKYIKDSKRGKALSAGLFRELLYGMKYTSDIKNMKKMNKELPVIFLSGDKDPVGKEGNGVIKTLKKFEKIGMKNAKIKLYAGLRHDILHEDSRYKIYTDIYKWIIE